MVLPLIAWGGIALASAVAGGSAIGFTSKPDEVNNTTFQNTYQNDYITNETTFDFNNSYFEDGSHIDLTNTNSAETTKSASQTSTQEGSKTSSNLSKYAVYAGLAVGAYYLYRRFKK
jgi:hypothetical protein